MTSARLGSGKSVADQKAACRTPCVLHVRHVGDRAEIENTWGLQMSPLLPSKRRRVKNYYFFWGIWAALPIVETQFWVEEAGVNKLLVPFALWPRGK